MRRLRLLWVTPNLPLRGVSAACERWWALLARLATRHEITLVAFVDPAEVAVVDGLPPGLAAVHRVARRPWTPDDPMAVLPRSVRGGFSDPALRAAIATRLASGAFDLAQYEWIEMANLIPPSSVPAVLTVQQLGFAQEGPRWRAEGRRLSAAPAAWFRYCRDLDWELRAVRHAHRVVTMSAEDAARLRRFLPDLPVSVSPVGVDCAAFRPPAPAPPIDADLLFVGNFVHPPNVDAARFLVEEVVPRVGRPVRTRIVGREIPTLVRALARPGAVDVAGPLADLRPVLAAAAIVVAPVRFGTGMRGKVLEAMAMGRPVVTTALGAEGLGATPDVELLLAEDAATFAAAVRRLLDDPAHAARVGAAGRALVERRFDWDVIARDHETIYETTLAAPTPPRPPLERAAFLRATVARLGWAPALAAGVGLAVTSAAARHVSGGRTST